MSNASFTIDLIVLALAPVTLVLFYSIWQVRAHNRYQLHKTLQVALTITLVVTVGVFEWEVRRHDWQKWAENSPYFDILIPYLVMHLCFAISSLILWGVVLYRALRNFPRPAAPAEHSRAHKRWAWIAVIDMSLTIITGWGMYYLAFVATN